jgi:hypothetical protein
LKKKLTKNHFATITRFDFQNQTGPVLSKTGPILSIFKSLIGTSGSSTLSIQHVARIQPFYLKGTRISLERFGRPKQLLLQSINRDGNGSGLGREDKNSTYDEIDSGEKSHLHPRGKFQIRTHQISGACRICKCVCYDSI